MAEYVKMHGASLAATCALLLSIGVILVGISGFLPRADAQQVLPGGRAARVHNFHAVLNYLDGPGVQWVELIPSAPGSNGFLITDIMVSGERSFDIRFRTGDDEFFRQRYVWTIDVQEPRLYSFEAGIPVPAGAKVECLEQLSSSKNYLHVMGCEY